MPSTQVCTCHRSTWSTPSRRSDDSNVESRKPREVFCSRPPRTRLIPAFVAMTISSRETTSPISEPISSSEAPSPYPAAVSIRVPPASANATNCSRASCSSVSRPQVSVPRPSRETLRPVRPTNLCCMEGTLSSGGLCQGLASPSSAPHPATGGACVVFARRSTVQQGARVIDFLKAIVLGLIQGLTEFLPISSSAHLRIFPELFGWGDPGAAFTAVIQIGTELAVVIYFRKDIWRIGSAWVQ